MYTCTDIGVLRIIVCAKGDLINHVSLILERLTFIIQEISKNPSNPKFNHYAFEAVSAMVKYVCAVQPNLVESFERSLSDTFQIILSHDVVGTKLLNQNSHRTFFRSCHSY
jgi:exportin-2 (importin alpha re-exporter)